MPRRSAPAKPPADTQPMRVCAAWGRRFLLRDESDSQTRRQARTRGKRLRPVCGDEVFAQPLAGESDWVIEQIGVRRNELSRPDLRGRREVLAANIDTVVVVVCETPSPDWFIVDRYLAAARQMQCDAILVWNKRDLASPDAELSTFESIGYRVISTSKDDATTVIPLTDALAGQRSIFVGQSGVGKSSLINALGAEQQQRTATISDANAEGRHTTVAATLLYLDHAIEVIDSPGVRDYAPSIESLVDVDQGFVEIDALAASCRFGNCMHRAEPGCAVKEALADETLSERRYQSYLRLVNLTRQLRADKY
ncbi:MAG: ribosome small subunit-dependent GTPase A [Pseudomonadota bacterium]